MGNILHFLLSPWQKPTPRDPEPEEIHFIRQAFYMASHSDVKTLKEMERDPICKGNMELTCMTEPTTNRTLLHAAMEWGNPECVCFLISIRCDLNKADESGETPLHAACMKDRVENLRSVLENEEGVDLEVKDMYNRTLLLKAMMYGSERVVRYLLTRAVNLDVHDVFGLTVLHVAVARNRLELVRLMAARGANLNVLSDGGRPSLSVAIDAANHTMVKELLVLGASTSHTSYAEQPSVTAMREFISRSERGVLSKQAEEILHLMLTAHGHPLHSDQPDVLQRVLHTADTEHYRPLIGLMNKLLVCSDSTCDDLQTRLAAAPQQAGRNKPRKVLKLFELARRSARVALMSSGRNVVWGVERLGSSVPPAVKGLLLLKDCDFKKFPVQN